MSADAISRAPAWRPMLRYTVLIAVAAAGLAIKQPFGMLLYWVIGKAPPSGHATLIEGFTGPGGASAQSRRLGGPLSGRLTLDRFIVQHEALATERRD